MDLLYRQVSTEDLHNMWKIRLEMSKYHLTSTDPFNDRLTMLVKKQYGFICFDGEQAIGFVIITLVENKPRLHVLCIRPEYEGYGIAQKLISLCEKNFQYMH